MAGSDAEVAEETTSGHSEGSASREESNTRGGAVLEERVARSSESYFITQPRAATQYTSSGRPWDNAGTPVQGRTAQRQQAQCPSQEQQPWPHHEGGGGIAHRCTHTQLVLQRGTSGPVLRQSSWLRGGFVLSLWREQHGGHPGGSQGGRDGSHRKQTI